MNRRRGIRSHFLEAVILILTFFLLISLLGALKVFGQEVQPDPLQWWSIEDYCGGINHELSKGELAPNQFRSLQNLFIVRDPLTNVCKLQCRKGWYKVGDKVSDAPLTWIDVFRTQEGASYYFLANNNDLWYRETPAGDTTRLLFARINRGSVTADSNSLLIIGDTLNVQKWMTLMGAGDGAYLLVDDADSGEVTYTIRYVVQDTLILLSTPTNMAHVEDTYALDWNEAQVNDAFAFNNSYWIYSSAGLMQFVSADSIIVDSLEGQRGIAHSLTLDPLYNALRVVISGLGVTQGELVDQFMQVTSHAIAADGDSCPIPAGNPLYMAYPVTKNIPGAVWLRNAGIIPELMATAGDTEYVVFNNLDYDSTTKIAFTADSIVVHGFDGNDYAYLEIWCDSTYDTEKAWFMEDTLLFYSADWFWSFQNNVAGVSKQVPWTQPSFCFPVAGGYIDSVDNEDCRIFVSAPHDSTDGRMQAIACDTAVDCWFFRMKRSLDHTSDSANYNWAALYDERVFYNRDDDPLFIWQTKPQFPESLSTAVGFYVSTHDGDRPIGALEQGEVLRVYCENSRHVVTSSDGYTYLINLLSRGVGCSGKHTLKEWNGIHYYLHRSGVFADDGSVGSVNLPISLSINSWFTDSIPENAYDEAIGLIYDRKYWLSLPLTWGGRKTLVYDLVAQAWTDLDNLAFPSACVDLVAPDSLRFLFGHPDSGYVLAYYGDDDEDDSIQAIIETGYEDFETIEQTKEFRFVQVAWEKESATALQCDLYPNSSLTSQWSLSISDATLFHQARINPAQIIGRNLALKLTISDAANYKHRLLKVGYYVKNLAD